MLYSINWPNVIVWLLFSRETDNICIVYISFPVDDAISFEIKPNFLIATFSYMI